jgi:hypothetical protein
VYLGFAVTAAFAHDQALGEIAARLNELIDCDGSRAYSVPLNGRLIEGTMTSTPRLWKFQTQVDASDWGFQSDRQIAAGRRLRRQAL